MPKASVPGWQKARLLHKSHFPPLSFHMPAPSHHCSTSEAHTSLPLLASIAPPFLPSPHVPPLPRSLPPTPHPAMTHVHILLVNNYSLLRGVQQVGLPQLHSHLLWQVTRPAPLLAAALPAAAHTTHQNHSCSVSVTDPFICGCWQREPRAPAKGTGDSCACCRWLVGGRQAFCRVAATIRRLRTAMALPCRPHQSVSPSQEAIQNAYPIPEGHHPRCLCP